jgi:acetylornithine deacetylase/succinyl-diaminopimelate desuccinylase-like protein
MGMTVTLCGPAAAQSSRTDSRDPKRSDSEMVEKAPPPRPIDYEKLTREAAEFLSKYIQLNTTNPPGDELAAAKLLREKFLDDGIPATVWEPQPGRGVVAARLHGGGHHTKALMLLSHMDVAAANPHTWDVPPLSGLIKDGSIWGRGALDDKGPGVIELMAMLAIKRAGILLNRDIIFLATGDKEQGGKDGAGWLVAHQANLFSDAGYVLNEGGWIRPLPNGRRLYAVAVTEKTPLWLKLASHGPAGGAAIAPEDTSVSRLIRALDRLLAYHPPLRLIDPVRDYYREIAQLEGGPPEYADLAKALRDDPEFAKGFLSVPLNNAMLRDTIAPTMLTGSEQIDEIPPDAQAQVDVRLLPAEDAQQVEHNIIKVLDDKNIKVGVLLNFPSTSSAQKSQLMTAISALAQANDATAAPSMSVEFTDSRFFRQKGLIAYGFTPIELNTAEEQTIHGVNEHIPLKELEGGIRRMVQLLEYMGDH